MAQINWKRCFKEAVAKANLAAHPLAKGAYMDLAEFYSSQAQRSAGNSLNLTSAEQRWAADGSKA